MRVNNLDKPQEHYAKWTMPYTKECIVCDLICMKFLEKQQLISGGGKIRIITTSRSSSYSDLEGYEETFCSQDNIPYCDRSLGCSGVIYLSTNSGSGYMYFIVGKFYIKRSTS